MLVLDSIAENRIQEAVRDGALDNLSGAGQPLVLDDDRHIPAELRMAWRILKNAGCVPPELELRREIACVEELLETVDDTDGTIARKLNYLMARLSAATGRETDLRVEQIYFDKLQQRLGRPA